MFRRISTSEYVIWLVATLLYLAAIVFLFPYFLRWVVLTVVGGSCSGAGGACGALATVIGVYVKPVLVLIGIVLYTLSAFKRLRGEFSRFWAVFAVAVIYASAPLLYALGNFWGANFSVGILALSAPLPLVALLLFGILLTLDIEDAPGYSGSLVDVTGPFGLPSGKLYAATAIWIIACAGVKLLLSISSILGVSMLPLLLLLVKSGMHWLISPQLPSVLNVLAGILLIMGLYSGSKEGGATVSEPRPVPAPRGGASPRGPARATFGRRND